MRRRKFINWLFSYVFIWASELIEGHLKCFSSYVGQFFFFIKLVLSWIWMGKKTLLIACHKAFDFVSETSSCMLTLLISTRYNNENLITLSWNFSACIFVRKYSYFFERMKKCTTVLRNSCRLYLLLMPAAQFYQLKMRVVYIWTSGVRNYH